MRLELDYVLPPELIAQEPAAERTAARLLVVGRQPEALAHETVAALPPLPRRRQRNRLAESSCKRSGFPE